MGSVAGDHVALAVGNQLGEGVMWSPEEKLVRWLDIDASRLWSFNPPEGSARSILLPEAASSFAVRSGGGLLLARAGGFSLADAGLTSFTSVGELGIGGDGVRLNDGRCDRQGRFVVASLDKKGRARGACYSIGPSLAPRMLFDAFNCGNSICFSRDGRTMYFADTPAGIIWKFDYDGDDGVPSNRRVYADLSGQPGKPDGSVVDEDDYVWNAQWGGAKIVRYDPKGHVDREIALPCRFPTCPAFGGEGLDILYVTSAQWPLGPQPPLPGDGSLYAVSTGSRGVPEPLFLG